MSARPPLTALILAGGEGRRMAGRDKGLLTWCGRPLIHWVVEAVRPQVDELLISANRHLADYRALGHPVIPDLRPGLGPLGGLMSALPHLASHHQLLTLPCDTPRLPRDLAIRLTPQQGEIAVARDPERIHWLIARYPVAALHDLADYLERGGRSVHGFLRSHPHRLVGFPDPAAFVNLNRPSDLEAAQCPP